MAKLYFYYSAMNAGKSTVLLQSAYNYQERGMDVLLFTAKIDTRFKEGHIHSRLGLSMKANIYDANLNLLAAVKSALAQNANIKCVLIDEAQFLSKAQVLQLTDIVDDLSLPVLAYGLRSDFKAEPFTGSQYLLIWADHLHEIKTICRCGKKAIMTARIDTAGNKMMEGTQIAIGGNEQYVSLCRKHYKELSK